MVVAGPPTASSCCSSSDMREMNEAKVEHIFSYLKNAVTDEEWGSREIPSISSALPLTSSALHYTTMESQTPSIAVLGREYNGCSAMVDPSISASWVNGSVESAQRTYLGIKQKIETLRFENETLTRSNDDLRSRLTVWHAEEQARRETAKREAQKELEELRDEMSKLKKRGAALEAKHQKEEDGLKEQVDQLNAQLRMERARREEDLRKVDSTNSAAMAAFKSKWQAQEKVSREKWRLAEAKRIKESTLQSLEPDIVLLLNRHKAEKSRLREEYENELRQRDEVIAAKDASVEELKSKLRREADEMLSREQESIRERLRTETERLTRLLEEERRLEKEKREQMEYHFEGQKRTLQNEVSRLGKELLQLKSAQTTEQANYHEAVSKEVLRITQESNEKMDRLKDKLLLEFTTREKEGESQNRKYLQDREEEMRRRCELERDTAIEKVVQRLEEEHLRALQSVRGSDGMLRERFTQLTHERERLVVELDLLREQLRSALQNGKSKDEELAKLSEKTVLSEKHVRAIEDRIRSEYETRMSILDHEWQKKLHDFESQHVNEVWRLQQKGDNLTQDIYRLKAEFEQEKKSIEQRHHVELSQINERVLVAMTKKENTIQSQSEQLLVLQEAINVREKELQRHRLLLQ